MYGDRVFYNKTSAGSSKPVYRLIFCTQKHIVYFWLYLCNAERVLGALGLNLELKARVYEAPTLCALFLLNNYNYIVKALQR